MNIFILHEDPTTAAQMQCNQHVVKMTTEQAQMLSYAHHVANPDKEWVAKNILFDLNKAHAKHPCTLWLLEDPRHYAWGYRLLLALLKEYNFRYDGLSHGKYSNIRKMLPSLASIPGSDLRADRVLDLPDEFVLAMGKAPECIGPYAVEAYRKFYIVDKNKFAIWKSRPAPKWFQRGVIQYAKYGDIQKVEVV